MKNKLKILIGVLVSALLLAFLFSKTDISLVTQTLSSISIFNLAIAFFLYLLILVIRTLRFRVLLKNRVRFTTLSLVVTAYTMLSNLLPFKTGEFSFIVLAKHKTDLKTGERVMIWLVSRIFDFLALGLLFILAISIVQPDSQIIQIATLAAIILIIGTTTFLVCLTLFGPIVKSITSRILALFRVQNIPIVKTLIGKLEQSIFAFQRLKNVRVLILTTILSATLWLTHAMFIYTLFQGFGLNTITYTQTVIVILISGLIQLIPIPGIANFGVYEGSITLPLISLGIPTQAAIAFAFSLHIIQLAFMSITGLASVWGLLQTKK